MKHATIEKIAYSDRNKTIRNAIAAAIGAAGIGAVAREISSKKKKREMNDVSQSKNAIILQVKKSKFMEGLPTPDELAESRGESVVQAKEPAQIENQTVEPADKPTGNVIQDGDIASIKREILRNKGRKFDFFRKAAEKSEDKGDDGKPSGNDEKKDVKSVGSDKKEDKSESGRVLFRGSDGKFVSPTDPLAVADVEKSAEYEWGKGIYNTIAHPIDTLGVMWESAKKKPVEYTIGGIGAIYLASLISDAINKSRRERSKKMLDDAREEYVSILEGGENEKKAESDPRATAGAIVGASFVVPMAIGAIIANRIIENRRAAKKKEEEMSDSYPDDPVIMYKTSEDNAIRITPETALFGFLVKRAMILSAEEDEANMVKAAQAGQGESVWSKLRGAAQRAVQPVVEKVQPLVQPVVEKVRAGAEAVMPEPMSVDEAYEAFMPRLESADNNEHLLNYVKSVVDPHAYALNPAQKLKMFDDMTKGMNIRKRARLAMTLRDPELGPQLESKIKTSERMQKLIMGRATDDNYAESWGKFKGDRVNHYLNKELGLKNGGWLQSVLAWIINHTGLANYFARKKINSQFADWRAAASKQMAGGNPQNGQNQTPQGAGSTGTTSQQGGTQQTVGTNGQTADAGKPKQ